MRVIIYTIIILLCLWLLVFQSTEFIASYFEIPKLDEPVLGNYNSDEASFLKTFYLMKGGMDYYHAFKISRENFSSGNLLQSDSFAWRSPIVFYLWSVLTQDGKGIFTLFLMFSSLLLISSYLITYKITMNKYLSILSPMVMMPYLYDTLMYKTAFLFTEWWGLFLFIYGLTLLAYNYRKSAFTLFYLSVISRELFIIPIFGLLIYSFILKQNRVYFVLLMVLSGVFFVFHRQLVLNTLIVQSTLSPNPALRFHYPSYVNLREMISFSMRSFALLGYKTHYLVLSVGLVSLAVSSFVYKRPLGRILLIIVTSLIVVFPAISVRENNYWGICFVPFILLSVPLIYPTKK